MPQPYRLSTEKSWSDVRTELEVQFERWAAFRHRRITWDVQNQTNGRHRDRLVALTYTLPDEPPVTLTMETQLNAESNLRVLTLAIESMRLNEVRGIRDIIREAYLALPPPAIQRDPWEVLGVRPDTDPVVIEASYKALARKYHPDTGPDGGDAAQMATLNDAYARVKQAAGATS